jgi:hypothetical protein
MLPQPEGSQAKKVPKKIFSPISNVFLVDCAGLAIEYEDKTFHINFGLDTIRVSLDKNNSVAIRLKNQRTAYKTSILGGFALSEEKTGEINYLKHFLVEWEDDMSMPGIRFLEFPKRLVRRYNRGQKIELGVEEIEKYHVVYRDGVEADIMRADEDGFSFNFSTGFYGSFWKEKDGSCIVWFKGDRLKPGEDDATSMSKFIVSRSKYTGNLLLILQDDATVVLN